MALFLRLGHRGEEPLIGGWDAILVSIPLLGIHGDLFACPSGALRDQCHENVPCSVDACRDRDPGAEKESVSATVVVDRAKGETPRSSASIVCRWKPASRFPILTVVSLMPVDGSVWFHVRDRHTHWRRRAGPSRSRPSSAFAGSPYVGERAARTRCRWLQNRSFRVGGGGAGGAVHVHGTQSLVQEENLDEQPLSHTRIRGHEEL